MKFSMNGFRRQLSNNIESLRDIVGAVVSDGYYDKEELIDAVNTMITHSNVLNCVYQDGDPEFVDMSELEVEHLEAK